MRDPEKEHKAMLERMRVADVFKFYCQRCQRRVDRLYNDGTMLVCKDCKSRR